MAFGLLDKFTNFLAPVEEVVFKEAAIAQERKAHLRLHTSNLHKIYVDSPRMFDDVQKYADYLKVSIAVIINYEHVDTMEQQRIHDFLDGVCYVAGGAAERISDRIMIYAPAHIDVNKQLYAYSIPAYIKR